MEEEKPYLDQLLSLYEAYLICHISPNSLRILCEDLVIPAQVVGNVWKIKRFDLELYLLQRRIESGQTTPVFTEYINMYEAAKLANTTPRKISLLCNKAFPAVLRESDWLIKRSDFEAYLANRQIKMAPRRSRKLERPEKKERPVKQTKPAKPTKRARRKTLETMLLSEDVLGREWDNLKEDEAWKDL